MELNRLITDEEVRDDKLRFSVDVISFVDRFGSDWSYETLINHDKATNEWKSIFTNWKERGILN